MFLRMLGKYGPRQHFSADSYFKSDDCDRTGRRQIQWNFDTSNVDGS